ncbi:MAG: GNAT family N-acetyltransferase [Lachnospiraceae bacterium]|nr:GNAT family N-acetyltransferase [Lachnospiraceae bacterium]
MELQFAPAQECDIEKIYASNKELIDTYEDIENIDYEKVLQWVLKKIETNIEEYVAVFLDGKKAGYYHFYPSEGKMELDDLYIFPEFRSKGIGTAIIQKCFEESDGTIFLYVFAKNVRAIALYEKLGFKIVKNIRDTRYIMEREKT